MTNKADLRLCGGTFFSLFLKSRKPLLSANEYYSGEAEPLAGPIALFALARVMVNDWPSIFSYHSRTIKGNTSEYKLCKNEGGSIFPFYDTDSKAAFTKNIAENYAGPLAQMSKAVAAFIDTGSTAKHVNLVKRLLTLIKMDTSIASDTLFYVLRNGQPVTKAALLEMTEYDLQPFLLGVWHYAVTRKEGNLVGAETIDFICPSTGGGRRDYNRSLDVFFIRSISVEAGTDTVSEDPEAIEDAEESTADAIEAEFVESFETNKDETDDDQPREMVTNQAIFQQFGNNGIQIGSVGTLNINRK